MQLLHFGERVSEIQRVARQSIHDGQRRSAHLWTSAAAGHVADSLLERPDLLKELVVKHGSHDGTARQTALAELDAMEVRTSQFHPGQEIPEKSWMYRLVKKFFYNDFGVYDGHDHSASSAPAVLELPTVVEEDEPVAV